jgi:hypothetical protein
LLHTERFSLFSSLNSISFCVYTALFFSFISTKFTLFLPLRKATQHECVNMSLRSSWDKYTEMELLDDMVVVPVKSLR